MSTTPFETTNLGWQLFQIQQRIAERWELMVNKFIENIADTQLPSWFYSSLAGMIAKITFWLLVTWVLIWIAWKFQRLIKLYLHRSKSKMNRAIPRTSKISAQQLTVADWVMQAQQLQQQKNYQGACQCLYQAMLQQLHDRRIVAHQASRTDGEYWQIIRKLTQPQPYQQLLRVHQEICFSNLKASFSLLESCWQAYREIEER